MKYCVKNDYRVGSISQSQTSTGSQGCGKRLILSPLAKWDVIFASFEMAFNVRLKKEGLMQAWVIADDRFRTTQLFPDKSANTADDPCEINMKM